MHPNTHSRRNQSLARDRKAFLNKKTFKEKCYSAVITKQLNMTHQDEDRDPYFKQQCANKTEGYVMQKD